MGLLLRRGDKGRAVREVQGLINSKAGRLVVQADGHFGHKTEEAVKLFQASLKLKNDGIVGAKTWSALHKNALPVAFDTNFAPTHDGFCITKLQKFFTDVAKHRAESGTANPSQKPAQAASSKPVPTATPTKAPPSLQKNLSAPQSSHSANAPAIVKPTDFKDYRRENYLGYSGRSYIINNPTRLVQHAVKLVGGAKIIGPNDPFPDGFLNECAQLVQYFGVPNTGKWRKGPRVCDFKPGELPVGTAIATLRGEKYFSDYSGRSHVGIYLGHDDYSSYLTSKNPAAGVTMLDQWNGTRIGVRTKRYIVDADQEGKPLKNNRTWIDNGVVRNKRVKWGDDGEEYYVILTDV